MQKSLLVLSLVLVLFAPGVYAEQKSSQFVIHELVLLPHPGKVVKNHAKEIGITKQEMQRIKKEIKAVYAPIFQDKIRQAFQIEQKVKRAVIAGKTHQDLKRELDEIAKLKREAMDSKIDALNHFRKILGEEKWKKVLSFAK